jgi:hypothetical protein
MGQLGGALIIFLINDSLHHFFQGDFGGMDHQRRWRVGWGGTLLCIAEPLGSLSATKLTVHHGIQRSMLRFTRCCCTCHINMNIDQVRPQGRKQQSHVPKRIFMLSAFVYSSICQV